jgi:hypothetical protein
MRSASLPLPRLLPIAVLSFCCFALIAGSVPLTADDSFLSKPPEEWTESEALHVLNDSPWAHTITTTTQDSQCDYEHPAFDGLVEEEFAREADSITPTPPAVEVKPDGAEYLVRLVSVKPIQAAVKRLMSLDFEKWKVYTSGAGLQPGSKPTNLEERWYNPADEITIALVLKRSGPEGRSFLDYAFRDKTIFPGGGLVHLWACSAIKSANGQVSAVTAGLGGGKSPTPSAIHLSFPRDYHGKPLISHQNEKLQVRIILNQRIFETIFYVNGTDLFDGTETIMHIPSRVDEPPPSPHL